MNFKRLGFYILKDKKPVLCETPEQYYEYIRTPYSRRVALTETDDVNVSTVFLCVDHSYGDGEPILFETMVFGGNYDQQCWRYCTYEEAERGHRYVESLVGISKIKAVK